MEIYLTPELKKYYTDCLQKGIAAGQLDSGLEDILTVINSNDNIQSIFSRRFQGSKDDNWVTEAQSYLWLAFKADVSESLKSILESFLLSIKRRGYKITNDLIASHIQDSDENSQICYERDKQYFNIEYYWIEFFSVQVEAHKIFWNELADVLRDAK